MTTQYVYDFTQGDKDQKDLLGGKGATFVFTVSPLETIDQDGVGRLIQIGAEKARPPGQG